MRPGDMRSYLILLACGVYVFIARALQFEIIGSDTMPAPEFPWVSVLLVAALVAAILVILARGRILSSDDWGFTLGKGFIVFLVLAVPAVLINEWREGGTAGAAVQLRGFIQLSLLMLVSQVVLRVVVPRTILKLTGSDGRWTNILVIVVSGVLFAVAHPLHGWQGWWFAASILMSMMVAVSDSVLYSWVQDVDRVARNYGVAAPLPFLIGMVIVYVIVAVGRRYLFGRRQRASVANNVSQP